MPGIQTNKQASKQTKKQPNAKNLRTPTLGTRESASIILPLIIIIISHNNKKAHTRRKTQKKCSFSFRRLFRSIKQNALFRRTRFRGLTNSKQFCSQTINYGMKENQKENKRKEKKSYNRLLNVNPRVPAECGAQSSFRLASRRRCVATLALCLVEKPAVNAPYKNGLIKKALRATLCLVSRIIFKAAQTYVLVLGREGSVLTQTHCIRLLMPYKTNLR